MRTIDINRRVLEMEYAVRGPIPQRAAELARAGREIIPCNIGNPQALGQRPLTYYRQILSLLEDPARIRRERTLRAGSGAPDTDAPDEYTLGVAEDILRRFKTGTGAYSESQGSLFIREAVAAFIDRRDGVSGGQKADPARIFLTNGASEGVRNILELLITSPADGIMIPIPQYPLYSATIRRCGGTQVNYYLDEDKGWCLTREELERARAEAAKQGVRVRALVVINPGNPTGAIMDEDTQANVVDFAEAHGIAILADEVYQDNVYGGTFVSFAKAVGSRNVPLFSFHSVSKGFFGECGHRGGYMEVRHPPAIEGASCTLQDVLIKQASVSLCSNTIGQILVGLAVQPPPPGTPPHARFMRERDGILSDLREKAELIKAAFPRMTGVRCFGRTGAMYLFPRLERLPAGTGDFDYCMALLEETGLCTVNGAGFGQKAGTHHVRIAFLPPQQQLTAVLDRWIGFHNRYCAAG